MKHNMFNWHKAIKQALQKNDADIREKVLVFRRPQMSTETFSPTSFQGTCPLALAIKK